MSLTLDNILDKLKALSSDDYKKFHTSLVPDTSLTVLGVKVPLVRELAKEMVKNDALALSFIEQEHMYYEEYILHGLVLGLLKKDFNFIIKKLDEFLPYIDSWGVCDITVAGLKIFKKHPEKVFEKIKIWLKSDSVYTVRFAIVTLLTYFLDKQFDQKIYLLVNQVKSDNYYVNMAIAWFYSIALIKQYNSAIKIIESKTLSPFVQNKAIQKARESFRINLQIKNYLVSFKIKN